MIFSYIKRLFKQLQKSKWIQIYFGLVIIQTVLSIPTLVKTLINTEDIIQEEGVNTAIGDQTVALQENNAIFGDYLTAKGYKVIYENVLFIVYETWRLWILMDGIVHLNSLTILASAWFSVFSCIFNVMLVVESRKWSSDGVYDNLKMENMHLQIVLTVIFFVLSVPIIIFAYKSAKIIGWQTYKKIGSSIILQHMYGTVQKFELILKIDIFFQIFFLIGVAIITEKTSFRVICIVMTILMACSIVFSRIAITRESHWMMGVFLTLELMLFACDVYSLIGLFQYQGPDLWYIGFVYGLASTISITALLSSQVTVYLAISCQKNFNKGLKQFVCWYPLQNFKPGTDNDETLNATEVGLLYGKSNERLPIDDDDDNDDIKLENGGRKYYYIHDTVDNQITRTSMEHVEKIKTDATTIELDMGVSKLNTVRVIDTTPAVPKLKLQPVRRIAEATAVTTEILNRQEGQTQYDNNASRIILKVEN